MKNLYRLELSFQVRSSFPRKRESRQNRKILSSCRWGSNQTGIIALIVFLSFSLFAQEPVPHGSTESYERASPSTSEEITNPNLPDDPQFAAAILMEIQKGSWTESRPPGPVFNTCSTWD